MTANAHRFAKGRRILITARLYGAGGIETHLLNLSRLLVDRGAEVSVVTRFANPETPLVKLRREIPVRWFDTPFAHDLRWFRLSTAWALAAWPLRLKAASFDVLYTLEVSRFTPFLRRFVRRGGYVVGNGAGEPLPDFNALDPVGRRALNAFIVESELQAAPLRRSSESVPVAAIPQMALVQKAPPRRPRTIDRFRVAFLGRYARQKGVYRLLDIWETLAGQSMRLDFFGHGAERAGLEQEIQRRGLADHVRVHGGWSSCDELAEIMAATDLVVLPSESEGLPLVLLEAMAYGVPFVASDVGAVRTLAEDNPDVRVVPPDNAALAAGIIEMAGAIRAGKVQGARLQEYHRCRYGAERIAHMWANALLQPERFWTEQRTSSAMPDPIRVAEESWFPGSL